HDVPRDGNDVPAGVGGGGQMKATGSPANVPTFVFRTLADGVTRFSTPEDRCEARRNPGQSSRPGSPTRRCLQLALDDVTDGALTGQAAWHRATRVEQLACLYEKTSAHYQNAHRSARVKKLFEQMGPDIDVDAAATF